MSDALDTDRKGAPVEQPVIKPVLYPSTGFGKWLRELNGSLAFTTYQSMRLFLVSADEAGQTEALERVMGAAMGLAVDPKGLWVCNKQQAWRFSNIGQKTFGNSTFDAVFMPQRGYFLGPCDVHDIVSNVRFRGKTHELLFVNTNYSCIATLDDYYNFRPVWKPDFISEITFGDRCHLNGIGARDGELAYATLCGRSDTSIGWKSMKKGGGCVVDIATNQVVCEGLSMPHSPRWYKGRLWLLNSGDGEFGHVDLSTGKFIVVARCPGFARGLSFIGDHAIIGLSKLRDNTFASGLPIAAHLESQHIPQTCGLLVIDMRNGAVAHWLRIEGVVTELYDVAFLPGISRPYTPGFSEMQASDTPGQGADEKCVVSPMAMLAN